MPDTTPCYRQVVGSLCSGYEGLGLGLELGLGHKVRHAWFVENDPAPSKILARHYPDVPNYGDLKTLDFAAMERVDILTAGYPCQPFSDAGLRKGADDPRHLWPYVADAIRALRPGYVLLENVRGHVRRGSDSVVADLAELGYDARWGLVRASDAGAPHRRERWFLAASDADCESARRHGAGVPRTAQEDGRSHLDLPALGAPGAPAADSTSQRRGEGRAEPAGQFRRPDAAECGPQALADADRDGLAGQSQRDLGPDGPGLEASQRADVDGRVLDWGVYEPAIRRWEAVLDRAAPWATEPRGRGGAARLSPRFVEWMMGLPAGWVTDVPDLSVNEQLKALGNGVVPQQAALAVRLLTPTGLRGGGVTDFRDLMAATDQFLADVAQLRADVEALPVVTPAESLARPLAKSAAAHRANSAKSERGL